MNITLDGEPVAAEATTLRGALEAAVEAAETKGRLVVEVLADGEAVDDELLSDPPDDASWTCQELRLESVKPDELVAKSLRDGMEALAMVRDDQASSAEHAQLGRTDEAYEAIRGVLETWQAIQEVVLRGSQLIGMELDSVRFVSPRDGKECSITDAVQSLAKALSELGRAVSDDDWASVADVLEGDLEDEAELWTALLGRVLALVEEG